MTKVITDLELLEKLAPHLEDMETEYIIRIYDKKVMINKDICKGEILDWYLKTLTTDEMFEFIGKRICHFTMPYPNAGILNGGLVIGDEEIKTKDFNEYLQKCIIYLLDNNLLGN